MFQRRHYEWLAEFCALWFNDTDERTKLVNALIDAMLESGQSIEPNRFIAYVQRVLDDPSKAHHL